MFSPVRLWRRTTPASTRAIARMPSHLTSNPHASSGVGSLEVSLASIGSIFCGIGLRSGSCGGSMRWIIQSFPLVWKRTYRPFSRLPWRTIMPSRSDHLIGSYVPSSQIRTCPPPYSPLGISPANLKYSSGWSSTCTARWFCFGSGGMPLGTAHETPTPSFSRRKSQCSRRAWCSWTTNRGARAAFLGTRAPGSGVFLKSRLASYSASFFAIRSKVRLRLLLPEADLEADALGPDLACPERACGGELLEPLGGVGAALEHLERRLRREIAEPAEVHAVDLGHDVGMGGVLAHVLDHRRPADAQDAVQLGERAARLRQVLEPGPPHDPVQRLRLEWHMGAIALPELGLHPRLACGLARDLDKGAADVEARHVDGAGTCHLDRQVAGAGRNFEHLAAGRHAIGDLPRLLAVNSELALRASHPRVPPRDQPFHLRAFEPPSSCLCHLHLTSPHLTALGINLR